MSAAVSRISSSEISALAATPARARASQVDPVPGAHLLDVLAVHPLELRFVEHGVLFRDAVERELAAQHVAAYERRLAVEGPTEKGQEVHHRVGQEAAVAELLDARCAVALGELLPVGA